MWKFTCHFTVPFEFEHSHFQQLPLPLPLPPLSFPFSKNEERHAGTTTGFDTSSPFTTTLGSEALAIALRTATQRRRRVASRCSRQPVSLFFSLHVLLYWHTSIPSVLTQVLRATPPPPPYTLALQFKRMVRFFFFFFFTRFLLTVLQHRHRLDEPTVGAATRRSTAPPRASTRQGGLRLTPRQLTHRQHEREHDGNERDDDDEHDINDNNDNNGDGDEAGDGDGWRRRRWRRGPGRSSGDGDGKWLD